MKYHNNYYNKKVFSPIGKPRYYFKGNLLYNIPKNSKLHFKNHNLKIKFKEHRKLRNGLKSLNYL